MTLNTTVETRVKTIIGERLDLDPDNVKLDANMGQDLGADSLDTVELIMAMEDEFDIEISDETAETIKTVQDAVDYINKAIKAKNEADPASSTGSTTES